MPVDSFTRHLEDYPRGREYSYMVTLTGSPYAWTDGKAQWGSVPMIGYENVVIINGALASTDWTFDFNADPHNPLDLGGGAAIVLLDENTRRTRRFFAPNFDGGFSTRLTAAAAADDTTFTVVDASGFANDSIGYIGLETVRITNNSPSTTPTVTRGLFGSLARPHNLMYGDDSILGPKLTLSPRVHRGRFLSVWMAPLDDDGAVPNVGATDHYYYRLSGASLAQLAASATPMGDDNVGGFFCWLRIVSGSARISETHDGTQQWFLNVEPGAEEWDFDDVTFTPPDLATDEWFAVAIPNVGSELLLYFNGAAVSLPGVVDGFVRGNGRIYTEDGIFEVLDPFYVDGVVVTTDHIAAHAARGPGADPLLDDGDWDIGSDVIALWRDDIVEGEVANRRALAHPLVVTGDVQALPFEEEYQYYKVWAGRVASVDFEGGLIKVSCDNLLAGLTKDEWPPPLPTGGFGASEPTFYFKESDLTISLKGRETNPNGLWFENLPSTRLGYRDSAGTFQPLPLVDGWFSLSQIGKYITDTVHNFIYTTDLLNSDVGVNYSDEIYNNFSVSVATGATPDIVQLITFCDLPVDIYMSMTVGIGKWLSTASPAGTLWGNEAPISQDIVLAFFTHKGIHLSATDTEILYYPDNRYDPLSPDHGCKDGNATMTGFARIHNGESFELISFTGEEAAGIDGQRRLTGVTRGLGGTAARAWGGNPNAEAGDAITTSSAPKIAQVWMTSRNNQPLPVDNFLLPALLSVDGSTGANSTYDLLGNRSGLAIPKEFVAYEEIRDTIRLLGLDSPAAFWVTEAKKGKEDIASFLQSNGLHFVAKRFAVTAATAGRGPYNYFGISVAPLDMTSRSSYLREITDADRSANTSVSTDFNERLIVNSIRLTPFYYYNKDASEVGGNVYAYAEESIADFGAYKTVEIRPAALYASITAGGALYTSQQDMYVGLAAKIGLRWFGAFANGSYLLTMESPHTGWRFQPGMPVQISLTGVTSPEADDDLSSLPARIMDVKHRHGSRPGATITARLAFGGGPVELAPCMRVTAHSGGTSLTVQPNWYTASNQMLPFPSLESSHGPTNDCHWFDRTEHGAANFSVYCWEIGDYANGQTKIVSAVTPGGAGTGTVTITTALSAGLQTAATAGRLVITLPVYGDASISDLSKSFAYIGSNASPSLLDGTDSAADYV